MKILALISLAWLSAVPLAAGVAITIPNKRALSQGQDQVVFDGVVDGTKHKKRVPVTLGVMSKCVQQTKGLDPQGAAINATIVLVGWMHRD